LVEIVHKKDRSLENLEVKWKKATYKKDWSVKAKIDWNKKDSEEEKGLLKGRGGLGRSNMNGYEKRWMCGIEMWGRKAAL